MFREFWLILERITRLFVRTHSPDCIVVYSLLCSTVGGNGLRRWGSLKIV